MYPELFDRGDTEGYRLCYRGPFATLLAQRPKRGGVLSGYPGYAVEDVSVKPDGAGREGPGTMLVTVARDGDGSGASITDDSVVEIESGSIDKMLLSHPRFVNITAEDAKKVRDLIDQGKPLPNPGARADIDNLYALWLKGVESYTVEAPAVRKTTFTATRPTVDKIGIGTRSVDKPHPAAPNGYQWLKISDRAIRQGRKGKWERVEVWQAADAWSEYLYGPLT